MSSEKGQGCSRTQGKDVDKIYKQGWKLLWKEDEWVRLLSRFLPCGCTVTGESLAGRDRQQVHLHRAVCACFSLLEVPHFGLEKSHASPFSCQVKQTSSHYDKPQILSGSIIGLWKLRRKKHLGGSTAEMLLASLVMTGTCHLLALSLLAAQAGSSSSLLIDSEINGKSLCKSWDEITTPV